MKFYHVFICILFPLLVVTVTTLFIYWPLAIWYWHGFVVWLTFLARKPYREAMEREGVVATITGFLWSLLLWPYLIYREFKDE
jgi:hypothetical protein